MKTLPPALLLERARADAKELVKRLTLLNVDLAYLKLPPLDAHPLTELITTLDRRIDRLKGARL